MSVRVTLGAALEAEVEAAAAALVADRVASRLVARDASLWGPDAEPEAEVRLGWVDASARAGALLDELAALRERFVAAGVERIVLCGMGGSSLAPEVIARREGVPLVVLDSTHPDQVRRALGGDLDRTGVVVSSKSGSTIETRSHRAAFEAAFRREGIDPSQRVVVVTDPGSPLEAAAREAGYRVFLADPEVGGRYSALTAFGLVPSALAGADVAALLAEAEAIRPQLGRDSPENPAVLLAAALAAGQPDRFVCALAEEGASAVGLGDWIEQLVAESTGKAGRGVLPLVLPPAAPERTGVLPASARLVRLGDAAGGTFASPSGVRPGAEELVMSGPLGAQLLVWEFATAMLCRLLGVDPFNQPDVESAKVAAREAMRGDAVPTVDAEAAEVPTRLGDAPDIELIDAPCAGDPTEGHPASERPTSLDAVVHRIREAVGPDGYLAVQAYLDREGPAVEAVLGLRDSLARSLALPVTLGWGPRFLHSTGQLHKGGPPTGVFLQLLDPARPEEPIPGSDAGFGVLIDAQAAGDRAVLRAAGRPVFALRSADPARLAERLAELVGAVPSTPPA